MLRRWTTGILLLSCLLGFISCDSGEEGSQIHPPELPRAEAATAPPAIELRQPASHTTTREQAVPQKAVDLLEKIRQRNGVPLPGYVGGKEFQNRERRLPRGRYREYDLNRKITGRSRDAERIVIEQQTGKAYYTGDHYRTFMPLN